jgi:hypothetical protein
LPTEPPTPHVADAPAEPTSPPARSRATTALAGAALAGALAATAASAAPVLAGMSLNHNETLIRR